MTKQAVVALMFHGVTPYLKSMKTDPGLSWTVVDNIYSVEVEVKNILQLFFNKN